MTHTQRTIADRKRKGEITIHMLIAGIIHLRNDIKSTRINAIPNPVLYNIGSMNVEEVGKMAYSTTSVAMPVIGQLKWIENAERASSRVVSAGKYRTFSPLVALRPLGIGSSEAWNSLPFLVVMVKVDNVVEGEGLPFLDRILAKLASFSQIRHWFKEKPLLWVRKFSIGSSQLHLVQTLVLG